jgi:peptidyl-prolyl cis-trans isomerase SurA
MQRSHISRNIQHCLLIGASAIILWLIWPRAAEAELVDRVIAIVNDEIITQSELEEEAAPIYTAIAKNNSEGSVLESIAQAKEATLDNMILERLIFQRAKKYKLTVSEEEVNNAYESMKRKAEADGIDFKERLAMSGMDEEQYRKRLRTQLMQNKLLSFDIRSKIVISDEMLKEYYEQHYTTNVTEGTYYLLQMGFSWAKDAASNPAELEKVKAKAKSLAERIHKLAESGQDFKELARKFSELPSAADGGDIGTFALDDMAEAMRDAIRPLKVGDISKIIETPTNYQFFKLLSGSDDAATVNAVPFEEVKEKIRDILYEEKLKSGYDEWVRDLKNNAYIQKL